MRKHGKWTKLPEPSYWVAGVALFVSMVVHLGSYIKIEGYERPTKPAKVAMGLGKDTAKIRIVSKKPARIQKKPPKDAKLPNKILETPQEETEAPVEATHLGQQNHIAKKETRLSRKTPSIPDANPGTKGQNIESQPAGKGYRGPAKGVQKVTKTRLKTQEPTRVTESNRPTISIGTVGSKSPVKVRPKGSPSVEKQGARNGYEGLLNKAFEGMIGQVDAGYKEFLDDQIAEGDRIDINTREYRFIGYFTQMRKAISLVWNYPMSAVRRGMQGVVKVEMKIEKNGDVSSVKVVETSGYPILDRAIVEAIDLASPFAPFPPSFNKTRMLVTGNFSYALGGYASSH